MTHLLGTAKHLATGVITLPVRVAARAYGLARGTVSAARDSGTPGSAWEATDPVDPAPPSPSPADMPSHLGTEPTPVNVTEELGLDPAPVPDPTPSAPRTAPVTSIDERAEPRLVDSTPADVAERINRAD